MGKHIVEHYKNIWYTTSASKVLSNYEELEKFYYILFSPVGNCTFDAILWRSGPKHETVIMFVEGMYSNIRRGAIQIYIPLQKYVFTRNLGQLIGDTREFFYLRAQYNYYSENKKRRYRQLDYLIELATLIASQV